MTMTAATGSSSPRRPGTPAALRAYASDVSAAAFADEMLRAGAPLPLSLPPPLQHQAYSAAGHLDRDVAHAGVVDRRGAHRGFDPSPRRLRRCAGTAPPPRPGA